MHLFRETNAPREKERGEERKRGKKNLLTSPNVVEKKTNWRFEFRVIAAAEVDRGEPIISSKFKLLSISLKFRNQIKRCGKFLVFETRQTRFLGKTQKNPDYV